MTQAKIKQTKPKTFQEYLDYDDGTDNSYELTDGELIRVSVETEKNTFIARCLGRQLEFFFGMRLVGVFCITPRKGIFHNETPESQFADCTTFVPSR